MLTASGLGSADAVARNVNECFLVTEMTRSSNDATPLFALTTVVPESIVAIPGGGPCPSGARSCTETVALEVVTRLPWASWISTCGAGNI